MIIDFHTHVFPDHIAFQALEKLQIAAKTNRITSYNVCYTKLLRLVAIFTECEARNNLDLQVSTANSISYRLVLNGSNLQHVARDLVTYRQTLEQAGQQILIYRQMIYQQLVENLLEGTDKQIDEFAGSFYNEKNLLYLHVQENDQTTLFQLHLIKLIQYYIFNQYEKGLKAASKVEP